MNQDNATHAPTEVYFVHKTSGTRFKVIARDTAAGTITLEGEYGTFTEKYDKELFAKNGYALERR
jgi:hypothetical protein